MSLDTTAAGDLHDQGMQVRRAVLGGEYVDKALSFDDDLSVEFQRFMTTYCWGEIWTDERLEPLQHSLLVLGITAALGKTREFEIHARGALRNGLDPKQLVAVIRQVAVYAGVPAAVSLLDSARSVLEAHRADVSA
ncbi:carboxymuconolactone decarboxylase family protein [Streptomyces carpinensis]|uniref:Carboxymuconolactone decarboxylase family protein n=1 Tax=Streptomyces carpinensis TaxID=66369 RepID=A0ABV1VYF4_9ACTN|nr:carboxymuconolactone decarboxylase family protein [Streptomyces carpinensis]